MTLALRTVAVLGACEVLLALVGWGPRAAGSVAAGVVVAVGNLWALARVVGPLLVGSAGGGSAARYGALAGLKILVLFGGLWLLMARGWVTPLPLLVGYGCLPLGIATGSLLAPRS